MTMLTQLRYKAFHLQQCCCYYCGLPMWESTHRTLLRDALDLPDVLLDSLRCTAEHLDARCDGGKDEPGNIVAACHWCNWKRHAHRPHCAPTVQAYQAEVQRKMTLGLWHPAARWLRWRRQQSAVG